MLGVVLLLLTQGDAAAVPSVSDIIRPPAGAKRLFQLHATGDQIYVSDGAKWTLSRPDATLFDAKGHKVGRHFKGPTWEYKDHSQVVGKAVANASPDPTSIPWLLVKAKAHKGKGEFSSVTFIQRIDTKGGKPTAEPGHKGQETRVHYSADYVFYTGK